VLKLAGLEGRPGVPPPEDAGVLSSFISQWGDKGWYLVLDETGELTKSWRIAYVDTTFVIDPEGNVELRSDGPVTPHSYQWPSRLLPALNRSRVCFSHHGISISSPPELPFEGISTLLAGEVIPASAYLPNYRFLDY
jgi:hypothetical protein